MQYPTSNAFPPKLTLYFSPKACSLASHIALEESGLPYQAIPVDIRAGANVAPEYLKINPGGIVPTLAVNNTVITESQAILTYIADLVPESGLIPRPGTRERAKAHEWMNWISSSMHVTYRSIFRPQAYAGDDAQAMAAVREHAQKKLGKILLEVETRLGSVGDAPYALGSSFSVVDAYLFVFYLWSFDERIQIELPARPRYGALAARVWQRSAARTAVAREREVRAYALPPELTAAMADEK
ncbi:glutathione S-transferase family protein [Paraburkholderia sediminicola]|uniref:glutathione S-transferase family protein n=1 Tax=Paraburkholderia sediminicola TaxID=458836 RepID=UPI0038B7E18D